ncbi:MAG: winged helix-turn-helix domain-containing protein [Gammaproteobacteria bacterium]|nr:winged helix-turn-helix domain-containing protein [Gammaproteobacteria bacterium]
MDRSAAGHGGPSPGWYRCGDVVVDVAAHTLLRDGSAQPVEPKAFAVLVLLLQHAGELVERDVLLDTVWGHRHVTPGVLTRVIAQLRAALGDDPHQPTFIQTLHGLGYRFIGELLPAPDAAQAEAPPRDRRSSDDDRRRALAAATLAETQLPKPQSGLAGDGPSSTAELAQPEPGSIAPAEAIA